ncbi:hypothetical protein H9P43_001864 [Blastocladiella emersonii ATCC 22665]|nr:hypothetical protein H9P43_001864 [Blastocladiella emersonii ATCC 22665]
MPIDTTTHADRVVATLAAQPNTSVAVHLYGATVTSWKAQGQEQLFLSDKAILNGTKAIRIPLVFPQFGTVAGSSLPQHGFARCSNWKLTHTTEEADHLQLHFTLTPAEIATPALREAWNYAFVLEYKVELRADGTLGTALKVTNTDDREFEFTWLLHTYLRVPDVSEIHVHGLDGKAYSDKTRALATFTQAGGLTFSEEVDRVFAKVEPVTAPLRIDFGGDHAPLAAVERTVSKSTGHAFADVVVWNPWADKAKGMADFGDDEYHHMVCVEVGDVVDNIKLAPGATREAGQVLRALGGGAKL